METLKSKLFAGDRTLEAALNADSAHIVPGAQGSHVLKIQSALLRLLRNPEPNIAADEARKGLYGPSTAAAVLRFKTDNRIINTAYQTRPDNIVGKMTMKALDQAMLNAPDPGPDRSPEVGAAILAALDAMTLALGSKNLKIAAPLRYRIELLRVAAAVATKGDLRFGGRIRTEYDRGSAHLLAIAPARGPIVFAAVPVAAAGGAVVALEIAIAALALVLLLCIVSEDFRDEVSRLAQDAIEAAAESALSATQEASNIRSLVKRCNETNPNPRPKCLERKNQFIQKDTDFKSSLSNATNAISTAAIRILQVSELERHALMVRVQDALVKLEKALKALKEAANALFDDCGCLFPKF